MAYDTGPGSGALLPATFAAASTPGSKTYNPNGQFALGTSAVNLKSDVQVPDPTNPIQGYIDLDYNGASVLVQQAYARYQDIIVGKTWSAFSDPDALPQTIVANEAPAGAVWRQQASLQYFHIDPSSGLLVGGSVEAPSSGDCYVAKTVSGTTLVNGTTIQTFPDLVARVRYQPSGWGNVQMAALFRELAYNDVLGTHRSSAWGLSANACFLTWGYDNIRTGVVGGEGIGSYLFGLNGDNTAGGVVTVGGPIEAASGIGAYASYEHYWDTNLWSTFAYGYAETDGAMLGIGITRQTQNAWVNLIWEINKYIDVGLQYDYGTQTLQSGSVTPNQQIQLTVQLSATPKAQTGGADTPSTRDFAHGYSAGAEAASTGLSNRRL